MIKHLFILAWFTWVISALGQGQIDLNNRGLAQVFDSTGKPLTGTNFVAVVLYGTSAATLNASFAPAPFRASTTTYPGTWNPAAVGGPGAIATLSGIAPGATVTMRVGVWDRAVFATWAAASAALQAGVSTVPTQVGLSEVFTYTTMADPLAIPGGMQKFPGLKLTALSNTGPVNQVPTADAQSLSINTGESKTVVLTGKDPEGAALKYTVVTLPANGALTGTAPNVVYTPKTGFTGSDSFTFKVNDGSLDSAVATVAVTVKAVNANQAPTADALSVSAVVGESTPVTLTGRDPEGAAIKFTVLTQPANGTLAGTAPALSYTPKSGFTGSDSFTFKVNDGALDSAVATVSISVSASGSQINLGNRGLALVNDATGAKLVGATFVAKVFYGVSENALNQSFVPSPFRVSTTTYPGSWNPAAVGGPGSLPTLAGFKPGSTVTLKVAVWDTAVFSSWEAASAALQAGTSAVPTQVGLSTAFTYTIPTDPLAIPGGMENFAGLKLTALSNTGPVNQAPTADGQTTSVAAGSSKSVVLTGNDPEGAMLKFTVVTLPANGTLSGTVPNVVYTPKSGFTGSDGFTFKVNDGSLDSALATVVITVTGGTVNQAPTADALSVSLAIGETKSLTLTGRDPEGAAIKFTVVTQPANGTLAGTAPNLNYTAKPGFTGSDSFTFKVNDGSLDSAVATVSISVTQTGGQIDLNNRGFALVNDASGAGLVGANFAARIFYGASENALNQSFTPAPFRVSTTTYPGTWNPSVAGGPGSIATLAGFNPGSTVTLKVAVWDTSVFSTWEAAEEALKLGKSTVPTQAGLSGAFTYTIPTDSLAIPGGMEKFPGLKLTALGNVVVNQAPTADGQSLSLVVGETTPVTLTGRDPEGAGLKFTVVTQPANGTLTGTVPNLTYAPKSGFTGSDSFTFKVNDGSLDSAVATVAISVFAGGAQINLGNRGLALVNDAAGKPVVGTSFVAKVFYGVSENALNQSFVPSPFRASTTTYPGSWNPAAVGGPGTLATLAGFNPGSTVTLKVAVWDTAVFSSWETASAALKAGGSPVPTQAGISTAFTYTIPTDPLAIPGGMENFAGLKLTALNNVIVNQAPTADGQSFGLNSGESKTVVLSGQDPEGASLKYTVVTQPANGTLAGTAPTLTYTAKAGFTGADSFTFKVSDGALDSVVATVAITVTAPTVVITPPDFPTDAPPWGKAPCICGPLVGNYQTNQIQTWHVLADGGSLDLQLTTVTVNTNDPQTTIVDAFDGTNRIATVTVSYTAAEARLNGLRWEKTASVNLGTFARGKVIRLESRIGGTPVTQTHYNLQFCGARWLAIALPSFKALEEDHAAYRFNVKSGESLVLDLDNVGIPTPASAFRYRLINPAGLIVKSGTNNIVAGPELSVASAVAGLWTLEMNPVGGEHYLLDKTSGADRHAYLDWYTSQRGVKEVYITVNNKPAVGVPFEVQLTRQRENGTPDVSDLVVSSVVTNGWARFVEIPNGFYKVDVRPLVTDIPPIAFQQDFIYCRNPVTNLFAFTRPNKLPVFDAIANAAIDEGKPFSLSLKAVDPDGSTLVFSLVGGPSGLTVNPAGVLSWTPGEVQGPGTNVVSVAVSDGTDSVTNRFTVVVKEVNVAPQIATVAKQTLDEGKTLALSLTATDVDLPKQPLVFSLVSGPAGLTVSASGQVSWLATEEFGGRTEVVKVAVSDGIQSVGAEFQVAINEVNAAPRIAAVPLRRVAEGNAVSFALSASDSDQPAQKLTFSLISGPEGLTVNATSGQVSFRPTEAQGPSTNTVVVRVTDSGVPVLSTTTSFTVVALEVNQAPELASVDSLTIDPMKPTVIRLSAKDADLPAQKLTFALVEGPKGMTVNPTEGVVSWTPTVEQALAQYPVTVSVSDGLRSVSTSFQVTVRSSNTAPKITDVALRRVAEGNALSFGLSASDSDQPAQKLTFSLISGPVGLTVNPTSGQVSFRPTEAQGPSTNTVVVRVTDNGTPVMSGTNSFSVVVLEINQAPELASVENLTIDALKPTVIRLSAKDADLPAQKLTFALVDGPKGMTVNPTEGVVSWTPAADQGSAQFPVTVSVSDGFRSVSTSFQVTVRVANAPPFFINLFGRSVRELNSMSFKLNGRDQDLPAQKLTYGVVSGPKGLVVSQDGQVTWTPTEDQGPSTNTVSVRVTDSGTPAASTTNSFLVFVTEANTAPYFSSVYSRSFLESFPLNLTMNGRDADLPAQKLTYTLVSFPKGMTMTEAGVIAWQPTEDQGPSTNNIVVRVTDNASTSLSSTTNFVVIVRESNQAPVFAVSNLTVAALSKLSVALKATDADIPVQKLSYRLDSGPQGLTVSTNGLLEWTPAANRALTTNVVRAAVSDGGAWIQSTFRIIVRAVGSGPGSVTKASQKTYLSLVVQPDQSLALKVAGPEGGRFRVESTSFLGVEWNTVEGVGEIETLGLDVPVVVPIPAEGAGEFRQFRLKKQ